MAVSCINRIRGNEGKVNDTRKNMKGGEGELWVVFVFAALLFAVTALLVIYIGNKTINAMKRDDRKLEKELKEKNMIEKENMNE